MQETEVLSLHWEDPLEEEMETRFSSLAWKIPWTEEPDGIKSMRSDTQESDTTEHTHIYWNLMLYTWN